MGELPYARGEILRSTEDDIVKLDRARREIARRRTDGEPLYDFTGLERALPAEEADLELMDDELAPALFRERLRVLAVDHLGGDAERDDAVLCNRTTAALVAAAGVLVAPGDAVVGVSAGYSHPAVRRAVALAGGRFTDAAAEDLARAVEREAPSVVVVTRLAVTYDVLETDALLDAVATARRAGARILVDDAGGARVGPAVFGQPRTLELDVDLGATGLDKYGTLGPRLGVLGGRRDLVAAARARAFELGLEARPMLYPAVVRSLERYDAERVRVLVATTNELASALEARLGSVVHRTPVTAQLRGEDLLEHALATSGVETTDVVAYEATAALAMLLLLDHGILTVHFAAVPPGTSAILFKFVPPELLERFGGADRFAEAVESSLARLAGAVADRSGVENLLTGRL